MFEIESAGSRRKTNWLSKQMNGSRTEKYKMQSPNERTNKQGTREKFNQLLRCERVDLFGWCRFAQLA